VSGGSDGAWPVARGAAQAAALLQLAAGDLAAEIREIRLCRPGQRGVGAEASRRRTAPLY
jgi:hypothetical protein